MPLTLLAGDLSETV